MKENIKKFLEKPSEKEVSDEIRLELLIVLNDYVPRVGGLSNRVDKAFFKICLKNNNNFIV